MIRLFCTEGGLPQWRPVVLQWSAEQTEWHRGQKGRDYCGQCCRHQKLLQPPVPHTPGLRAARQQMIRKDLNTLKQRIMSQHSCSV